MNVKNDRNRIREPNLDYQRIAPIMGLLWAPLAAVTSRWQGKVNAQIAVAISAASIVPDRPRTIIQIYKENYSHNLIYQSRAFALNFLRKDQLQLIKDFGLVSGSQRDKLAELAYSTKVTGSPILDDCLGYLDCRVVNVMDGGDMTCFLAEVVDGYADGEAEPLTWREARRRMPKEWNDEWAAKISADIEISRQRMGQIDFTPRLP